MVGRENHIARFAKELETSWQGLEARLQRCREEAATGTSTVAERARVLELRCAQIEHDLAAHMTEQSDTNHRLTEKTSAATSTVDALEMNLKSSDVVTHTTVTRVDEISERLAIVEDDCRSKAKADYWQPQMEALQRADTKFEAKLATMEKDFMQRLQQEASNRDGVKQQLHETLKACMDKILASKPIEKGRFAEVAAASPMSEDCSSGIVTPRCNFGTSPRGAWASRTSSVAVPGGQLQPCVGMPGADKLARTISPTRVVMRPVDASPQSAQQAAQPTFRTVPPRRG
mmetsp:Transcript_65933/g.191081  ORF Transcript_65933/g.191081 Transcript_65933/m.191081 type:complete len:288 (+) Transcript_65933:2-865(+)